MDTKAIVKSVPLFSSLDDSEIQIIERYCAHKELFRQEKLFSFDESFNLLCIVTSGSIGIYSNGAQNRLIARYIPNESFGELNLCGISLGNVEAIALDDAGVLLFPATGTFVSFVTDHTDIGAKIIYKLLSNISYRIRETNKLISQNYGWVSELRKAIYTDRLTGLYNRQYCEELFRENKEYVIAIVKPDKFKMINDTCGHKAGDATLVAIAQSIRKALPFATHIRYRSDEFMIVIASDADIKKTAATIAEAIKAIDIHAITDGAINAITASIGISKNSVTQQAIENTYAIMWSAYNNGGNSIAMEGTK
ncbi:MAG: GGDEF domain-containing protein [Spirochaetes bacterium]|jgi:diguanylate cyclase (GGDEF)-like protein|nr:GGDEF domain-containing protein [Spirochaetota bacterium]